ncbi:MAG TPA: gamma-glutamyltransferase [Microbacterium sp.]|uniref:gamma-glutamyltransferase family protein n=1 Tax=Microbacterium sp. TaxID=51671 RepID=UPI002B47EA38|nr:gamma-glutamyltransferase [Microbacterium sp.]HKT55675.1 gamma-glutamyltransferase [Microbacterium sp.]
MPFTPPAAFTTRPTLTGSFGMAASTHWIATGVAQGILERGGNAFDAVVAGGFALHLVEPHLNGPGGDLVGIFVTGDRPDTPRVLMGQGPAPSNATIAHFRREGLHLVPGAGGLAAAVPGAVDAWLLLLRDHGVLSLRDVLAPTIAYARSGVPLSATAAAAIGRVAGLFRSHWRSSADLWLADGVPAEGDLVRNPRYADLLDELATAATGQERTRGIDRARELWAQTVGRAASAFLATPHRHSDGADHAAVIRTEDVTGFRAGYEDAVTIPFRGLTVAKAGAWTQGPALLEALLILEPLPDDLLDPSTPSGAHAVVEALKLALADRDAHFGDGVDVGPLLTADYADARRAGIGEEASHAWRPGTPGGRRPYWPPLTLDASAEGADALGVGEPTVAVTGQTRGDTCHIDVVDRWGNVVAVTPSGGWLQSSPAIPELGFCLGTRLQMTWLDEAAPSALRPGARPRTTLTPTLVIDEHSAMAIGTPGGDQQEQWQLPALLRILVGGYSPQQAIDAPTLHTTALIDSFWPRSWTPAGVVVEGRIGEAVVQELRDRGHDVTVSGDWSLGRLSAVGIDRRSGRVWAAANARGMLGYAAGR